MHAKYPTDRYKNGLVKTCKNHKLHWTGFRKPRQKFPCLSEVKVKKDILKTNTSEDDSIPPEYQKRK